MKIDVEISSKFKNKKILIAAGGTGGHIFPALAQGHYFQQLGAKVYWLGSEYGLEKKIVPEYFPIEYLSFTGIRKKGLKRYLSAPFSLLNAIFQAKKIIKKHQVDLVIGFGGYVAAPTGLAAKFLRKPLIIHEQNARSGLTNRLLAKFANEVLSAFQTANLPAKKLKVVGNPLRQEILDLYDVDKKFFKDNSLKVLVTGGSQGAKILNELVPKAIKCLKSDYQVQSIEVFHQSGQPMFDQVKKAYNNLDKVTVDVFIKDMKRAYQWADVIICRSGALTVSEVETVGIPAIFIPYPFAVDDHQFYNAEMLVKQQAAICIRQENLDEIKLAEILLQFTQKPQKLNEMSSSAKKCAKIQATSEISSVVAKYL